MRKGFTLIELLIVITILGVLVVAILSAINPIEQIRRAQDQGTESDAAELLNAFERYYTAFFKYPWGDTEPKKWLVEDYKVVWIEKELIRTEEVKPQFLDRGSWKKIYVTQEKDGTIVSLCFDPASTTFQTQADKEGTGDGKNQDGSSGCKKDCWICIPR